MPSFKEPTFQERQSLAMQAREKALAKLKAKPPVDEAVLAERRAAREAKDAADAVAREDKRVAREAEKAEKRRLAEEAAAAAEAERLASVKPELTDEEKKALRDARYAARKQRKKGH